MHFAHKIIRFIFNAGLSCANTRKHYGNHEVIRSITKDFEENGQLAPKHKGGVCYPILEEEQIQWLVEWIHVDPHFTI